MTVVVFDRSGRSPFSLFIAPHFLICHRFGTSAEVCLFRASVGLCAESVTGAVPFPYRQQKVHTVLPHCLCYYHYFSKANLTWKCRIKRTLREICQQVGVDKMAEMVYTGHSGRLCPAVEARALLGSACGGSNRVVWSPSSN